MKANINYGNGKLNKINVTVECNDYVSLVKEAYEVLLNYQPKWSTLDEELNAWYETACEMQEDLRDKEYFDIDDVNFTEESARKFLNRRSGANGASGFNYSIIE